MRASVDCVRVWGLPSFAYAYSLQAAVVLFFFFFAQVIDTVTLLPLHLTDVSFSLCSFVLCWLSYEKVPFLPHVMDVGHALFMLEYTVLLSMRFMNI